MKRIAAVLTLVSMVLGITAFECQSTDLTSAKMKLKIILKVLKHIIYWEI